MEHTAASENFVQAALDTACSLLRRNLPAFTDRFPGPCTVDGFYVPGDNVDWTTGFCTGEYWLAYEYSGDEAFKSAALTQVDSFQQRIIDKVNVDHHDMGFLYTPSCVAAYM